jgi:putative FmdB family regulatory protein
MPLYDFECSICNYKGEVLQAISGPSILACPNCLKIDSVQLENLRTHEIGFNEVSKKYFTYHKKISAATFKLKGNGWYETDFKNKK